MRRHGFDVASVVCHGAFPKLFTDGTCRIGRLRLRCTPVPVEIGAMFGGTLVIGDGVFINQGAWVVAKQSITLGDNVLIGPYVAIYDTDFHPMDDSSAIRTGPVTIGSNAWIGHGATILPGVTVGDHAVVGAGAVVVEDVPARTLVGGSPARPLRKLTAKDGWRRP